jgi:hypothetical protein
VSVRVDEPGNDDLAGRVELPSVADPEVRPNGRDARVLDQDVSPPQIAKAVVDGDDGRVPDDDAVAQIRLSGLVVCGALSGAARAPKLDHPQKPVKRARWQI